MKNLHYLPLVLATGCAGSCDSKEDEMSTMYKSPCEDINLDLQAYKKDNNAEIARILDSIKVCDVNLETLSTIGLKKILDANCKPEDQKWYNAFTNGVVDPGIIEGLAEETDLSYIKPDSVYNWNAKLVDCEWQHLQSDPSKTGLSCSALFVEFSHAQATRDSLVTVMCTQDIEVAETAARAGARTDLDLSKVRLGLNDEVVLRNLLKR